MTDLYKHLGIRLKTREEIERENIIDEQVRQFKYCLTQCYGKRGCEKIDWINIDSKPPEQVICPWYDIMQNDLNKIENGCNPRETTFPNLERLLKQDRMLLLLSGALDKNE